MKVEIPQRLVDLFHTEMIFDMFYNINNLRVSKHRFPDDEEHLLRIIVSDKELDKSTQVYSYFNIVGDVATITAVGPMRHEEFHKYTDEQKKLAKQYMGLLFQEMLDWINKQDQYRYNEAESVLYKIGKRLKRAGK